jgi:threonylcarbamoyladenosine tRNA methylthiotransferase MtaB
MLAFSIHTLGCKLNQLEGEAVADAFRREGFAVIPWEAPDPPRRLMVLNTCTVTSMAEQKARRLIRAALREGACVLVTGCYAQLDSEELEALGEGGRLFIIAADKKSALLDLPRRLADGMAGGDGPGELSEFIRAWLPGPGGKTAGRLVDRAGDGAAGDGPKGTFRFAPADFSVHTRGFLKIQDGCDGRCTYCRVRLARGESVSLPPEEALGRLRALERGGCAEAVLTGVNICRYAFSEGEGGVPLDLGGLLDRLLGGTERIRLRLSSLGPEEITGSLLRSLAHTRLRPHFHLSVQSGSRRVLERMGRSYGPERVEQAVSQLRRLRGDPFLACDIIVGFPGEDDEDFKQTLELCERADFAWIHVFPYSPRPGTPAWNFKGRLPQREVRVRADRLLDLARRGRRNYIHRWIGREVELIPELKGAGGRGEGRGWGEAFCAATSENYLKLLVPRPAGDIPPVLRCRLREMPGPREIPNLAPEDIPGNTLEDFDALGDLCP